jgi:hypothetical protein
LTDEYQTWLNGLKVGDKVALLYRHYEDERYSIEKIEKITPTRQIKIVGYETKFKNGDMIDTSPWKTTTHRLVPITDEVKKFIEKKRLIAFIQKVELNKLDVQQLRKIKEVMGVV